MKTIVPDKPAPPDEMTEFDMEWHHLSIARTALEWSIIVVVLAIAVHRLWPYFTH
ncbi:MAG: hypothetical protein ABI373_00090 [Flavobacteriales bacterium]